MKKMRMPVSATPQRLARESDALHFEFLMGKSFNHPDIQKAIQIIIPQVVREQGDGGGWVSAATSRPGVSPIVVREDATGLQAQIRANTIYLSPGGTLRAPAFFGRGIEVNRWRPAAGAVKMRGGREGGRGPC